MDGRGGRFSSGYLDTDKCRWWGLEKQERLASDRHPPNLVWEVENFPSHPNRPAWLPPSVTVLPSMDGIMDAHMHTYVPMGTSLPRRDETPRQ